MPQYVHKRFRVKAFSLLATQSLIMLGIMVLVHLVTSHVNMNPEVMQVAFYILGMLTLIPIMVLRSKEKEYPLNYGLMVVITLFSGIWWGSLSSTTLGFILHAWDSHYVHFQVFACVCGTLCAAASLAAVQPSAERQYRRSAAVAPLLLGWTVSAIAEVLVCVRLGMPLLSAVVATSCALLLFALLIFEAVQGIIEVGGLLVECNPDSFMRVVLAMDSKLLVIISLPLFLLANCLEHARVERRAPEAAVTPPRQPEG